MRSVMFMWFVVFVVDYMLCDCKNNTFFWNLQIYLRLIAKFVEFSAFFAPI